MGLFERLAESFPTEQTVFGECLLIPINLFKNEWNEQLTKEGVKAFQQSYNGRMFFFLKKPNSSSHAQAEPPLIQEQQPEPLKRFEWTAENFELVRKLRAQGLSFREISRRLAQMGFKIHPVSISRKMKGATAPKPQTLNCDDDGLFRELMQSAELLYSHGLRKACSVLLRQASNILEQG